MAFARKRTLLLTAVLAVALCAGLAYAKTLCNSCKGTGKILEVTKQCPLHQPLLGHCANCDGSGLVGPPCPYCGGLGYILTAAEKEAEKKARAKADSAAQAEHDAEVAKRAVERAREDSVARVEKAKLDAAKARMVQGARSADNIYSEVMKYASGLRLAYNQRLRENPNLKGRLVVRISINEFGKVTSVQVVESTVYDSEFESTVVSYVKRWEFGKINAPGDVSTVTYPFNFNT
jgi:TonB family protein